MEKEKAIEIIKGLIRTAELGYNSNPLSKEGQHTATEALTLAISALEQQEADRWIPVTERLPEVGQSVMISVAGVYTAEGCLKEDGNWCQFRWSAERDRAVVGAWKPLPEPYTEEEV